MAAETVSPGADCLIDVLNRHQAKRNGTSPGAPTPAERFAMFAPAKIKLDHLPAGLRDVAQMNGLPLVAGLPATNAKGQPASGTITPPSINWHAP